jgi:hypothetical protein
MYIMAIMIEVMPPHNKNHTHHIYAKMMLIIRFSQKFVHFAQINGYIIKLSNLNIII